MNILCKDPFCTRPSSFCQSMPSSPRFQRTSHERLCSSIVIHGGFCGYYVRTPETSLQLRDAQGPCLNVPQNVQVRGLAKPCLVGRQHDHSNLAHDHALGSSYFTVPSINQSSYWISPDRDSKLSDTTACCGNVGPD